VKKSERLKKIDKKQVKHTAGRCRLCGNPSYEVLDVHRINYNSEYKKYSLDNTVVLCSNCHRKVHDEKTIVIDRWYASTAGPMLRIIENGIEKFV